MAELARFCMRRVRSTGRPPSVKIILPLPGLCAAKDVEGIAEHFWTMKGIKLIHRERTMDCIMGTILWRFLMEVIHLIQLLVREKCHAD